MDDAVPILDEPDLEEPRYLYVRLPRCPRCGGTRFRGNHTTRRSAGQTMRHSRCLACGQRINIVRE